MSSGEEVFNTVYSLFGSAGGNSGRRTGGLRGKKDSGSRPVFKEPIYAALCRRKMRVLGRLLRLPIIAENETTTADQKSLNDQVFQLSRTPMHTQCMTAVANHPTHLR
jgi:hypothetical protein